MQIFDGSSLTTLHTTYFSLIGQRFIIILFVFLALDSEDPEG